MKNKILYFIIVMLAVFQRKASAQYSSMTFETDPSILNQFTVMETGAGALMPAVYYNTFHKGYQKTAYFTSKNTFRMLHSRSAKNQVAKADSVRTNLSKRASIADLDLVSSDPTSDVAWRVEGPKIESSMESFNRNINKIMSAGGSNEDYDNWKQIYNCIQSGINIIRKSYLTMGQRQSEYISYYKEILQRNRTLVVRLQEWKGYKIVDEFNRRGIKPERLTKNETIAYDCLFRWTQNFEVANAGGKSRSK